MRSQGECAEVTRGGATSQNSMVSQAGGGESLACTTSSDRIRESLSTQAISSSRLVTPEKGITFFEPSAGKKGALFWTDTSLEATVGGAAASSMQKLAQKRSIAPPRPATQADVSGSRTRRDTILVVGMIFQDVRARQARLSRATGPS